MILPGFTAEASLGPATGRYRGSAASRRSRAVEILPMQESMDAIVSGYPCTQPWQPWLKSVPCCGYLPTGRLYCACTTYPVWYQCRDITPWGPSCLVCYPPTAALGA
jgi:hypothetical protein